MKDNNLEKHQKSNFHIDKQNKRKRNKSEFCDFCNVYVRKVKEV